MEQEVKNEALLRKYLLGELSEADEQVFEEQLFADEELSELLLAEEDELIDDYLGGELSEGERVRFDSYFMVTPERRKKLKFGDALRRNNRAHSTEMEKEPSAATEQTAGSRPKGRKPAGEDPPIQLSSVVDARSPVNALKTAGWSRASSSPYLRLAAMAVIVFGLGIGAWRAFIYQSEIDKAIEALERAYGNERPTDARISGWSYAPRKDIRGNDLERTEKIARDRAESLIFGAAGSDSKSLRALGLLYLARRDFATAKAQLERALALDPNNAQLRSDYAAVLLEAGKASQSAGRSGAAFEEFGRSLEHLDKALELDGSLLEALFNRALCKEYLLLLRPAADDWKIYIERDTNSRWSEEARERLADLERLLGPTSANSKEPFEDFLDALAAKDAQRVWSLLIQNRGHEGSSLENKLLASFLDRATGTGKQDAKSILDGLAYAAEIGQERGGDRFGLDLVQFYKTATVSQRTLASRARTLLGTGHKNYANTNFDAALDCYSRGKAAFGLAGNVCEAMYADYLIGVCLVQQSRVELGVSNLKDLTRNCESAQYRWLHSQVLTTLCGAGQLTRNFSEALSYGNQSVELCKEMHDDVGALRARYQLGEVYRFVENGQKALDIFASDLPRARIYFTKPATLWARYFSISSEFDRLKLVRASIDFQEEALRFANEAKVPRLVCRSLNYLGFLLSKTGKFDDAENCIKRAIAIADSLPETAVRAEVIAYSYLQLGSLYRRSRNFKNAVENYDKAVQAYEELDNKFFAFTARKDKLLCCIEHGACPSVEQEMERVINLFEDHRTKILEDSNRNTFFDAEQGIYDVAIEFEYLKNNRQKAFEYSERSRGRSLADFASGGARLIDSVTDGTDVTAASGSAPLIGYDELRKGIPKQSQILQYAVLKDTLLIWVVSTAGIEIAAKPISNDDLSERVNNFLRHLSNASEFDFAAFSLEAASLYDLLIRPVEGILDGSKQLCIVPDKILNYLPFGALMPAASTYMVEERDFILSPGSSIFIKCSNYAREKESSKFEKGLIVGNPSFRAGEYGDLGDLESAEDEARSIAAYYQATPITGTAATKGRVLTEMERSEVIHLATHAITDEWDPRRSKLLLARSPIAAERQSNDGVLQAFDIYKLDLSRVKLVVLSACQSAVERYYGGEGMVGLSRPFIAQRIPLVVASLWPVESGSTARLMTSFHRYRKTGVGMPTVPALCQAQRDMIRGKNKDDRLPRNWASFITIGGYANF